MQILVSIGAYHETRRLHAPIYSRSLKVGTPIASILKRNAKGIPALIVLHEVCNFLGFTIGLSSVLKCPYTLDECKGPRSQELRMRACGCS